MADGDDKIDHMPDEKKLFFSVSPDDSTGSRSSSRELLGGHVGPYKLISVLGEGGFGIVYLAEQHEPIRRRVALKVIKPGMDSAQVLARFEAERQALALLDHPNIAHIFDAGITDAGRPYFVMEQIDGLAITEFCDTHKLSIDDRLKVFLQACAAVQHAHQKGIIHRDIKPSNILVSIQDGESLVRIIDFGVAKALNQPLTDRTLNTIQSQIIGTPEYMSPEQTDMANMDIDTRSDVYSLGAVLYELLTGAQPYDPASLRDSGVDTMRRIIAEQEPLRPSTRLLGLGREAKGIADNRLTEIGTLVNRLGRELEWIPLKAMRKDPAHRYQSASELADDIQNYLRGSALSAGPESLIYKVRKLVTKHKWSVAAGLAVFVSLTAGLIVSSTLYLSAEDARSKEENQRNVAETERDRATEAERQAQQTLVNLYEEQGRRYMDSGELDKALLVLSEAYSIDSSRESTEFLLSACISSHENPAMRGKQDVIPWPDKYAAMDDVPFSVSLDRKLIALVDEDGGCVEVFDTETAGLKNRFSCRDVVQLLFSPTNKDIVIKLEGDKSHHVLKVLDLETNRGVFSTKRNNVDIDRLYELVDANMPSHKQVKSVFDSIFMDPDGDWFAFMDLAEVPGQLSQSMNLWDFESGELHTVQDERLGTLVKAMGLRTASAYGSSKKLMTLHVDKVAKPWSIPNLEPYNSFAWSANSVLIGPRGITVMNIYGDGAWLMNRSSNYSVRSFPDTIAAGYGPDETRVVVIQRVTPEDVSDVNSVTNLWRPFDGAHVCGMAGPEVKNWHFTPNSRLLVTEHDGGQVKVWFTADGSLLFGTDPDEHLIVTDIGPDSRLLLTRGTDQTQKVRIWNLNANDSFELYQGMPWRTDLSTGFVCASITTPLTFSHIPSTRLPRFNADGSRLITECGLRQARWESVSREHVARLIRANIALRLEEGRFRRASTAEMLLARWDYHLRMEGERHHETVNAALDMIVHEIETGEPQNSRKLGTQILSWQPFEQTELSSRVQKALHNLAIAYRVRADRRERQGRYAEAMADYESAIKFCNDDPNMYNDLAWVQATCRDGELRDGLEAMENARRACELTDWNNWHCLSTYAVSCAERGNFADAVAFQKKALDLMPDWAWDKWQANFAKRLRLFRSGQCYRREKFFQFPHKNLIGWWKFDEQSGRRILDSSGNGNHAESRGKPIAQLGKIGNAIRFERANDFVAIPKSPVFDITDAMTVAAWFQTDEAKKGTSRRNLMSRSHSWSIFLSQKTNELTFSCQGLDVPSIYPRFALAAKKNVQDGQWHHVVGVYDGASMLLYLDGALDASAEASGEIIVNKFELVIGADKITGGTGWFGSIDDVRIYNCALNALEIAQLYGDTR